MSSMTPRKLNALVFIVVGMLLLIKRRAPEQAFAGANSLLLAAINSLCFPPSSYLRWGFIGSRPKASIHETSAS